MAIGDKVGAELAVSVMRVVVLNTFFASILSSTVFAHDQSIAFDALPFIGIEDIVNALYAGCLVLADLAAMKSVGAERAHSLIEKVIIALALRAYSRPFALRAMRIEGVA